MVQRRAPRVRMKDVADRAGVSTRTVSNVVNNYVHVSDEMRDRVRTAIAELGYQMDYLARGLRNGRSGFIALAVPHFGEPYFAALAQAVISAARRREVMVLVEATDADAAIERAIVEGSLSNVADGVLLSGVSARVRTPPATPLVMLGEHSVSPRTPQVCIDNQAAAATVVDYLVAQGRRRIVALGVQPSDTAELRYRGYQQALRRAGLREPVSAGRDSAAVWSPELGYELASEVLKRRTKRPDAVFAFNDSLAIGVLRAFHDHSVAVPEEIAVVGIDGIDQGKYTHPALTTIAADLDSLAERSVDLLLSQIEDGPQAAPRRRQVFTPYQLVVRASA